MTEKENDAPTTPREQQQQSKSIPVPVAGPAVAAHSDSDSDSDSEKDLQPRFVMDISLFRFAKMLRLCGCDVLCDDKLRAGRMVATAQAEKRILITSVGRLLPQLTRHTCVVDLTFGRHQKATWKNQQAQGRKSQSERQSRENSGCRDDDDDDGGDDAGKQQQPQAQHQEQETSKEPPQDPRNFHTVVDPESKKRVKRRLVGYDSDGDSEYEEIELAGGNDDHDDGGEAAGEDDERLKYCVVDIHAPFKQQLSGIIVFTHVQWIPSLLFTRCVHDNGKIAAVPKDSVKGSVAEGIFALYENFYRCPTCLRIFWGVSDGACLNFKSARTVEHMRALFNSEPKHSASQSTFQSGGSALPNTPSKFVPAPPTTTTTMTTTASSSSSAATTKTVVHTWGRVKRHLFSFPRKVKVVLFGFMDDASLDALVAACELFRELVHKHKSGLDLTFVPERKRRNKRNPAFPAYAARQHQQRAAQELLAAAAAAAPGGSASAAQQFE